ncbi:MAG TPA: molybdenum cofactor biosynthesis protein MoaE [Acidimicrobiales bacterium]|nr:molybdenum cofactor biosynthesis protein MoaE [Acidimicrobiales bacterium]
MVPPPAQGDWVALVDSPLPLATVASWPILPGCGAVVMFTGTVRDYAEDRPGVVSVDYEVYEEAATAQLWEVAADLRRRWPVLGRIALLHRTGLLVPTDISVVVAVSAPHRPEAFEAARYGIDAVKSRVPIWKRETWEGGQAWGLDTHPLEGAPQLEGARQNGAVPQNGGGAQLGGAQRPVLSEHGPMGPLGD